MPRTRPRTLFLATLALGVSLTLGAAVCEGLLRLLFRDGGRTTFMGPGGHAFEYTYAAPGQLRSPMESGPKAPGVRRILVQGDSITWGDGVREWTDTYPIRLLDRINGPGHWYDMAVHAYDGKEIDNHLATIAGAIERTDPDIVVYQWFINDVEINRALRPQHERSWRTWPWHDDLQAKSFLCYVLDFAADKFLPVPGRSYLTYLEQDYAPGTPGWTLYARTFHAWAEHAIAYADRTILMLYPPVPVDALKDLRSRAATLAAGQVMAFGPNELQHPAGYVDAGQGGAEIVAKAGVMGDMAVTRAIVLAHGDYTAAVHLQSVSPNDGEPAHVTITVGNDRVADTTLSNLPDNHDWQTIEVPFRVEPKLAGDVRVHVTGGDAAIAVDRIELPVHYGIEVLDLAPRLRGMHTATSYFDAHPSAATHAAMADALAMQIRSVKGY